MPSFANPSSHAFVSLALLTLTACGGGGGSGAVGNTTADGVSLPAMLLSSTDLGTGLLGQLLGVPFDSNAVAGKFLEFEGTPWINGQSSETGTGYSLAYNSVDGQFYGVLNGTGAHGTGVIVAFDPVTNRMKVLKTLSKVSASNETVNGVSVPFVQPYEYRMRPVVSPDGKSLMLRASLGGILDRGVLTHINLDPTSNNYLKDTVVYSFYDYEKNNGGTCVALLSPAHRATEMVLQGGSIYMGLGGFTYQLSLNASDPSHRVSCNPITNALTNGITQQQIPATVFSLTPSNASDWSQNWVYSNPPNTGRVSTGTYSPWSYRMGRLAYWSDSASTLKWTAYDINESSDYLRFYSGVTDNGNLYSHTAECINPLGWLHTDRANGNVVLCGGGDLSGPSSYFASLFSLSAGSQSLVFQTPFNNWGYTKTMTGATSSLLSRRLFVNGGDKVSKDCYVDTVLKCGASSSIEEVNPAYSYARTSLSAGDENKTGLFYLGNPGVGGSANEPIADRYVVWFGAQVKGYSNVLNKYDRLTGETLTLPLDPKLGAHPVGKPLDLGNGQILGTIKNAPPVKLSTGAYKDDGLGGYQGGPSNSASTYGFYWANLKSGKIVRLASPNVDNVTAWNMEPIQLSDGTVWSAYSNDTSTTQRVIGQLNTTTGKVDTFKSFVEASGAPTAAFALASRANVVYTPLWSSSSTQAVGCVRADNAHNAYQSATVASMGAGTAIVFGATDSSVNGALYMPIAGATLGSILEIDKGVADSNLCKAAPIVSAIAQNLTDLPATKILALKNGALVYGTTNGKLMLLDPSKPANDRVRVLADMFISGATSAVKGYLAEVSDGVIAAVVMDYQGTRNTGRRLVQFNMATGTQSSRDISTLISEFEPYPGALRVE